ncbi:hypothetical protein PF003_g12124 [Phytophthora fragariae]|nr:hypothetical protein PF003_g12124 [Phytophthora fragariae]
MALGDSVECSSAVKLPEMIEDNEGSTRVDATLCFQVRQHNILGRFPSLST